MRFGLLPKYERSTVLVFEDTTRNALDPLPYSLTACRPEGGCINCKWVWPSRTGCSPPNVGRRFDAQVRRFSWGHYKACPEWKRRK